MKNGKILSGVRKEITSVTSTVTAATFITMLQASALPVVWINEIHYDNSGTDVNEFVEIAGTAGSDLSSLQLLLYNGGDGKRYSTLTLTGTLADQQNGFGVRSFSFSPTALQNGPADGVVLYDAVSQTVIQFLSYEGSFTATDGVASGLTSVNLGVSQEPAPVIGMTLSLTGSGSSYADFIWSAPVGATPGLVNEGQSFTATASPAGVPDAGCSLGMLAFAALGLGVCKRHEWSVS